MGRECSEVMSIGRCDRSIREGKQLSGPVINGAFGHSTMRNDQLHRGILCFREPSVSGFCFHHPRGFSGDKRRAAVLKFFHGRVG
jgi:hypothetical protein